MNATDRRQAASSSVGKPTITSAWIATPGIASRTRPTTARVVGRRRSAGPSAAARRRRRTGAAGGSAAASAARRRPRPGAARRRRAAARSTRAGSARRRSRRGAAGRAPPASAPSGVWAPRNPRSDQPPSYVPMLIPVRTISRWPARERASDVLEHGLRGEAPLRAARRRDDAVRAEERAAVLDLDERARPLDRGAAVGDAVDLDARQGRQRAVRAAPPRAGARARRARRAPRASPSLRPVVDEPGGRIGRRERVRGRPGPSSRSRRSRRPGSRGGRGGRPGATSGRRSTVTVQVLTRTRSARRVAVDEGDATLAEQAGGRLHLRLVDLAAEVGDRAPVRTGGHHSCGFVLIRKPIVPTRAGHRVADVALALRPGAARRGRRPPPGCRSGGAGSAAG